jgi:hypothetical protein
MGHVIARADDREGQTATIRAELPTRPRSFRLTEQDLERLQRLQRRLGRSQTDIISMALIHLSVSLERDERVHLAETPKAEG